MTEPDTETETMDEDRTERTDRQEEEDLETRAAEEAGGERRQPDPRDPRRRTGARIGGEAEGRIDRLQNEQDPGLDQDYPGASP